MKKNVSVISILLISVSLLTNNYNMGMKKSLTGFFFSKDPENDQHGCNTCQQKIEELKAIIKEKDEQIAKHARQIAHIYTLLNLLEFPTDTNASKTLLHIATEHDHNDMLEDILQAPGADANKPSKAIRVKLSHHNDTTYYIDNTPICNTYVSEAQYQRVNTDQTPLATAVSHNNKEAIDLLLKYKAVPTLKELSMAAQSGYTEIVDALVQHTCFTEIKKMPLTNIKEYQILKTLLNYEANPNLHDRAGKTPLIWAIENKCDLKLIGLLLQYSANPNLCAKNTAPAKSVYPIVLAIQNNDEQLFGLLVQYGAKPLLYKKKNRFSIKKINAILEFAAIFGNKNIIRYLVELANIPISKKTVTLAKKKKDKAVHYYLQSRLEIQKGKTGKRTDNKDLDMVYGLTGPIFNREYPLCKINFTIESDKFFDSEEKDRVIQLIEKNIDPQKFTVIAKKESDIEYTFTLTGKYLFPKGKQQALSNILQEYKEK